MVAVRALLLFLALLAGGSAHALIPSVETPQYHVFITALSADGPRVSGKQGACDAAAPLLMGVPDFGAVSVTSEAVGAGSFCYATVVFSWGTVNNYGVGTIYTDAPVQACPANSTLSGSACQCNAGFQENAAKTACEAGASEAEKFCQAMSGLTINTGGSGSIPTSSCHMPEPPFDAPEGGKGCGVSIGDAAKYPDADGKVIWSGVGKFLGGTCTPSPTPGGEPAESKDDKCPGGFAGTVQGVEKCIPVEPDKGIEGVKTGSSTDANGTKKDVKEETKCEGQKCTTTTTTTTTTSSGTVTTSTATTTEAITDKCQKDPSNQVCQKTQGGQGRGVSDSSCQTNPSAKGCGGEGAAVGDLYTGKGDTIQGIMDQAVADLKGSGIGGAVGGFFTVSGGGSCPALVWNVPYVNVTATVPGLCSDIANTIYSVLSGVLLVVAGFVAFRVAIDN